MNGNHNEYYVCVNYSGIDIRYDGGLSLALALWSRSAVLLDLNRGDDALADIQCAIDNGLDNVKKKLDYYVRMAKANASKYLMEQSSSSMNGRITVRASLF